MPGLEHLFLNPQTAKQKRYEAIRAVEVDKLQVANAAKKFGYTKKALYTYIRIYVYTYIRIYVYT